MLDIPAVLYEPGKTPTRTRIPLAQLHSPKTAILDESDRKRLKRSCNDIVLETRNAREWPDFPDNAVAIASNGTGDKLVLLSNPSSDRLGDEIYWWDHETGELTKVADDFLDLRDVG